MENAGDAKRTAPTPAGVLRGHHAPVNALRALSSASIVSGSGDGVVKLWDLKSRREVSSLDAHSKAGILEVTTLHDSRLITHGRDGSIKLWDLSTFSSAAQPVHEWYCGSFTFTKVATMRWRDTADRSELVISPSANEKDILVYDPRMNASTPAMFVRLADTEKKRGMCMSLSLFSSQPSAGAETGDGVQSHQSYIAAGWEGGQLTLLDLRAGGKLACEAQVASGTNPLLAFDVSQDGRTIVCGSSSEELSTVSIDYASLEMNVTPFFKVNQGGISYVRLRADQRIFATAGWDHRVRVFHTRKLKPLAILKYHSESVFAVDFTPDNNFLVSASKDHKIALWSIYPPSPESAQTLMRPARA